MSALALTSLFLTIVVKGMLSGPSWSDQAGHHDKSSLTLERPYAFGYLSLEYTKTVLTLQLHLVKATFWSIISQPKNKFLKPSLILKLQHCTQNLRSAEPY